MSAIIKALAQLARSTYDGEEHRPMDDIRRAICAAAVREHDRLLLDRGELCRLIGALLGHTNIAVTQRHYVKAGTMEAVKQGEAWKQLRPIETDGEESDD